MEKLGVAWLDVHCPIDAQMQGQDPLATLLRQVRRRTSLTLAVAGGINSETAAAAAEAGADVVIVGGAITKAADPKAAAADIRRPSTAASPSPRELFKRATDADLRELLQQGPHQQHLRRLRTASRAWLACCRFCRASSPAARP